MGTPGIFRGICPTISLSFVMVKMFFYDRAEYSDSLAAENIALTKIILTARSRNAAGAQKQLTQNPRVSQIPGAFF